MHTTLITAAPALADAITGTSAAVLARAAVASPALAPVPPSSIEIVASASPPLEVASPPVDVAARLVSRGRAALLMLLEAQQAAGELRRSVWDFAVEGQSLRDAGLTNSDFRWLIVKGYVEHAREITVKAASARSFRANRSLMLLRRTCFVFTESGVEFGVAACHTAVNAAAETAHTMAHDANVTKSVADCAPTWDSDRQELRFGGHLVKQFKVPAANQEMILAVFQEEHWPARIDDPLPPRPDQDQKRRLQDTVNSLNRNQKCALVRFHSDGKAQGVRWEPV